MYYSNSLLSANHMVKGNYVGRSNYPKKTICLKCQSLFTGKIKKNIFNLLSAKSTKWLVEVKGGMVNLYHFLG